MFVVFIKCVWLQWRETSDNILYIHCIYIVYILYIAGITSARAHARNKGPLDAAPDSPQRREVQRSQGGPYYLTTILYIFVYICIYLYIFVYICILFYFFNIKRANCDPSRKLRRDFLTLEQFFI